MHRPTFCLSLRTTSAMVNILAGAWLGSDTTAVRSAPHLRGAGVALPPPLFSSSRAFI